MTSTLETLNSNPWLAYNFQDLNDYTAERPFLDWMKLSRGVQGSNGTGWDGALSESGMATAGALDSRRWPIAIPGGYTSVGWIWDWGDATAPTYKTDPLAGTYHIFVGSGWNVTFNVGINASGLTDLGGGHWTFNNANGYKWTLNVTAISTVDDTSPMFVVIKDEFLWLYQQGEIFNPDFLRGLRESRLIRPMRWSNAISSTKVTWAERKVMNAQRWTPDCPYEVQIALANKLGADLHICMPRAADDDHISQLATLVRDNLDPALMASPELGCEEWNFGSGYWKALSTSDWGVEHAFEYYGMRNIQCNRIWSEVFAAGSNPPDLRLTLYTNINNTYITGVMLANTPWQTYGTGVTAYQSLDGGDYFDPVPYIDTVSITSYFGGAAVKDPTLRAALVAEIDSLGSGGDPASMIWDNLNNPALQNSLTDDPSVWDAQQTTIDNFIATSSNPSKVIYLTAYEGGSHTDHTYGVSIPAGELASLASYMPTWAYSQAHADAYAVQIANWFAQGRTLEFMQYQYCTYPSVYGSWGLYRYLGDVNPRADYVAELNHTVAAGFGDGGGERYFPSIIEQLAVGETIRLYSRGGLIEGAGSNVIHAPRGQITRDESDPTIYNIAHAAGATRAKGIGAIVWTN